MAGNQYKYIKLSDIETLVVVHNNHTPVAFMSIEASKIGMLFVSPDYDSSNVLVSYRGQAWWNLGESALNKREKKNRTIPIIYTEVLLIYWNKGR